MSGLPVFDVIDGTHKKNQSLILIVFTDAGLFQIKSSVLLPPVLPLQDILTLESQVCCDNSKVQRGGKGRQ